MRTFSSRPIGVFDSGVGGLTVVSAIRKLLPYEDIVYFGDTAHTPWGNQSKEAIVEYCLKITDLLASYNCKAIVIACNTASSVAVSEIEKHNNKQIKLFDVIEPTLNYVLRNNVSGSIGLIGTTRTIGSKAYEKKLALKNPAMKLIAKATPLLAPLVEEGAIDRKFTIDILNYYLKEGELANIDNLILGCTHYPLLSHKIKEIYGGNINVIESGGCVAIELFRYLKENQQLHNGSGGQLKFILSSRSKQFLDMVQTFLGVEVDSLELV